MTQKGKLLFLLLVPVLMAFWWLPSIPFSTQDRRPAFCLPLRADPGFSSEQLPEEIAPWYHRFLAVLYNPRQYLNATLLAKSNNTYHYGRALNTHITSMLQVFRITGDMRILAEVDRLAELMRAQLRDRSVLRRGGNIHETDGYLNWQYRHDKGYEGTDVHQMDEMLSHALIAAIAHAYQVNRDLDPRYAERARFWTDYLANHFEAKWRKRKGIPRGFPFLEKHLIHVTMQWIRYHYYMAQLTGNEAYENEARRMAETVRRHIRKIPVREGTAAMWNHTTAVKGHLAHDPQPFQYARYTVQAAADLASENFDVFSEPGFMEDLAATLAHFVMNDPTGATFAFHIDGSGKKRETAARYAISPWTMLGRWSDDRKILSISEKAYFLAEENPDRPRRIYIPAGMVFSLARQAPPPWRCQD